MENNWWNPNVLKLEPAQLTEEQIMKWMVKPENMPDYLVKEPKNEQEK